MQTIPEMVETCRINCANESYPPAKYSRYERMGFVQGRPLATLARAIEETLGRGALNLDWLFDSGAEWRRPPAKRAFRSVGNVIHANFAR